MSENFKTEKLDQDEVVYFKYNSIKTNLHYTTFA
jgi:hypothetical protein